LALRVGENVTVNATAQSGTKRISLTEGNEDNERFQVWAKQKSLFPLLPSVKIFSFENLEQRLFYTEGNEAEQTGFSNRR
jgi:hypothetical protein